MTRYYYSPDALLMVRFASDVIHEMASVLKNLEVILGPDTTTLGMRIGLHR